MKRRKYSFCILTRQNSYSGNLSCIQSTSLMYILTTKVSDTVLR